MPFEDELARRDPAPGLFLPLTLLERYLFFLSRRPISSSNSHFLARRLAGLRSLAPYLERAELDDSADLLRRLVPRNFARLGPVLQARLNHGAGPRRVPDDVVVTNRPPSADFLDPVRRLLLIVGPGICVGDELLCFALPRWLRQRLPEVEIHLLSAYPDLWAGVEDVDRVNYYDGYGEIVEAIRGDGAGGPADLVLMVDFESPSLTAAICHEEKVRRYAEISLGARSAIAYDADSRWLHSLPSPSPYFRSYYYALSHILRWFGCRPRLDVRRSLLAAPESRRPDGRVTILVSPFTSKQEPSVEYWSRLAAGLVPAAEAAAARFLFDPGPNLTTERFARDLARATRALAPTGLACELATSHRGRTLTLGEIFAVMGLSDVVLCSDSYSAHAAPLFGCAALVLAQPGLEDWRVPETQSYYFEETHSVPRLAAGMRQVLTALVGWRTLPEPWRPPTGGRLIDASRSLARRFDDGAAGAELLSSYDHLSRAYSALRSASRSWPRGLETVFADCRYGRLLPSLPADRAAGADRMADMELHVRARFESWVNSNLYKYLELTAGRTTAAESAA